MTACTKGKQVEALRYNRRMIEERTLLPVWEWDFELVLGPDSNRTGLHPEGFASKNFNDL